MVSVHVQALKMLK